MGTRRVAIRMTNSTYNRRNVTVSRWKKSAASSPDACAAGTPADSCRPPVAQGRSLPRLGCGWCGTDPVAQAHKFALDAPVRPSWVVPGQAEHKIAQLVADPWGPGRFG